MIIDPQTRTRYPTPKHGVDIVVDATGPAALSQETVELIGGFKDYTGSGGVPTKQLMLMPVPNSLWGTDAWVDGAKNFDRDVLGNVKKFTRLRQKRKILSL